ncbi:MAG TPA: squalene--hopene cyclase [Desulfuromonadales bacterium]|nr:squalene--hopene cyclase [Desulfuromonadales bacterium]
MSFSSEISVQLGLHQTPETSPQKRTFRDSHLPEEPAPPGNRLEESLSRAAGRLQALQRPQGYWVFDLEADATIPSEYIFLQRFRNKPIDSGLQKRLVTYLYRRQLPDGGWPLYTGGSTDLSASVKAYFALKLAGDSPTAPHMVKARSKILSMGGAARVNVFTRIALALFGQIPWHTAPAMPVEIMLLPKRFFFHLDKVSYWSRTVVVPLLILYAKRPVCRLSPGEEVRELFAEPPENLRHLDRFTSTGLLKNCFIFLDRVLKRTERFFPSSTRHKALRRAEQWTLTRMKGEGGIGAIFPAMANAVMALQVLGYREDHPDLARGIQAIEDLLVDHGEESLCQPCLSPIWDTCLGLSASLEAGLHPGSAAATKAVEWLFKQQIFVKGDWANRGPDLKPGGWAFQFENTLYPDLDDTPMVLMALLRAGAFRKDEHQNQIVQAANWIIGMQSSDGGWGAFDIDNNYLYLNHIPFADHGALLDPSTADVTARCIELLSLLGFNRDFPSIACGLAFLRREQEAFGGWFGRWGVNYIYGTWSVLVALRQVGEDMSQPYVRRAVAWLESIQNADGGWGETCRTYNDPSLAGTGPSTAEQTAWALLGLMAAGEATGAAVQRGVLYLQSTQNAQGGWDGTLYTGTGFPKVFYLCYHGYSLFFPLWALGVYKRLVANGKTCEDEVKQQIPPELASRVAG